MKEKYLPFIKVEIEKPGGKIEYLFMPDISRDEYNRLDKIYKIVFPLSFDGFFPKTLVDYEKERLWNELKRRTKNLYKIWKRNLKKIISLLA